MVDKINELGPQNVSRHSRLPLFITVVDISVQAIPANKRRLFEMRSGGCSKGEEWSDLAIQYRHIWGLSLMTRHSISKCLLMQNWPA